MSLTPAERFFAKVDWGERYKGTRCLLWIAAKDQHGYGRFWVEGKKYMLAHRWLYERWVGPIPAGLQLDHLCFTPSCVNPDHLEPVTQQENTKRAMARISHCPHGHEYTEENTRMYRGARFCRTCSDLRSLARAIARRSLSS